MRIFLGVCNLIIPIIMILIGVITMRDIPEKVNNYVGYRNARSMKNIDTWRFANRYSGRVLRKLGVIGFIVSIIVTILGLLLSLEVLGILSIFLVVFQLCLIFSSIYFVERKLKEKFDDNGDYR